MSDTVKLSSRLAKDELTNGLDSLAATLTADPDQVVVSIAWMTVQKITHDVETHADVPTVMIKRVEPIGVVSKVPDEIIKLALELNAARTGRTPLPFDVTETIDGGFVQPEAS